MHMHACNIYFSISVIHIIIATCKLKVLCLLVVKKERTEGHPVWAWPENRVSLVVMGHGRAAPLPRIRRQEIVPSSVVVA